MSAFKGTIQKTYTITCGECIVPTHFGFGEDNYLEGVSSLTFAKIVAHRAGWRLEPGRKGRGWICPACVQREASAKIVRAIRTGQV